MKTAQPATPKLDASTFKRLLCVAALAPVLVITNCGGSAAPGSPSSNTTVVVTPATATLYRGETQRFVAKVSGSSDQGVTWQTPYGTIDNTGLYTAPTDVDSVAFSVTATSNSSFGTSGSALVTLPAVTFTIAPNAIAIALGASQGFNAALAGLANTQVTWKIAEAGGGTITNAGFYSAPPTSGVYHVVALSAENVNYSATAIVAVTKNPTSFSRTGDLKHGHVYHTATLLQDGRVLVAGGATLDNNYNLVGIDSAELYDPLSGTFDLTGTMTSGRYAQTSTLLAGAEVLIIGGIGDSTFDYGDTVSALATAELYDPSDGLFTSIGSMAQAREGHTATLLKNNKVLVTGGSLSGLGPGSFGGITSTAEIYDPQTKLFTPTGNMTAARAGQTATLLADGRVLIAGGQTALVPIVTVELYDPGTALFTPTGSMAVARLGHTATLLQDGRVLIAGGIGSDYIPTDTAEVYDPATGVFLATGSMALPRWTHSATLLPDGTVLVVDGENQVAEVYDPVTGSFSPSAVTESIRSGHSATLLQNGKVIVIGGWGSIETAELYP